MRKYVTDYLPIVPALLIFVLLARYLNFTQDDAYISYRYVANFLNGHGLVYNIGERIEGFTNFGWVIYMILVGGLGFGYILVSKITGLLLGAGVIVVTFLIARTLFDQNKKLLAVTSTYLVAANLSLAYWSPAGLETAAFAFVTSLSLYWFLKRDNLLIVGLMLAVWIRPEGAVVAGLLIIAEAVSERRMPIFALRSAGAALVLSLPYVVFKQVYYGSIIPNPFYAKTSMNATSLANGLGYAWEFLRDYGLGGVGLIAPLLFFKRLTTGQRSILIFTLGYLAYIVLVGGDVLKVHRFFVPVMGLSAILLFITMHLMTARLTSQSRQAVFLFGALVIGGLTIYLPYRTVVDFRDLERSFTMRMRTLADGIGKSDKRDFSVAIPTIGIIGYTLLGHDIIDMVGLTDSTIARYSDEPVPGMATTWKERKHNSVYLLKRAPDYIAFSTGVKPSAPAEKALMMYSSFQNAYRSVGWYFEDPFAAPRGITLSAFKKVRPVVGPIQPDYPLRYVEDLKLGTQEYAAGNYAKAIGPLEDAIKAAGRLNPSPELLYTLGYCYGSTGKGEAGVACLSRAIEIDSLAFAPHRDLYMFDLANGDLAGARLHREYLLKIVPWYVPRLDSLAARGAIRAGKGPAEPR